MASIGIISNPYQKLITYERYDEPSKKWVNVVDGSYRGALASDKLMHGFFPFIVKDVVDELIAEFGAAGPIRLYFAGTADEYGNLQDVCEHEGYADRIRLQPLERTLNNADQVLPKIIGIFNGNIRPIIEKSMSMDAAYRASIAKDLAKYSDASDDVIPIFVIGNYSAGKSTFINALIGAEILPSGDEAVTARICKIHQSEPDQPANVAFTYAGQRTIIDITDLGYSMRQPATNNVVTARMAEEFAAMGQQGYAARMNTALAVLNEFSGTDENLDPIVEIHVPFNKGLWGDVGFAGKFMILDTPGSNAASHTDHKAVLTESMQGMSNGIPIYVATSDTLDSTDNESLYDIIRGMEGLDSRFTMIIVNKADKANLPREGYFTDEEQDNILHQAIPRNLYSSGIFFVSSIMGLGAKNGGQFVDDYYDDIFESSQTRYTNESSRHYKQLYKYDIMPDQIRPESMAAAEAEAGKDKLFANSGLFSVEHAIQTFASKYAAYNKCQQSQLFLRKIIEATKTQLARVTEERETVKWNMRTRLEQDRQGMIDDIEQAAESEAQRYIAAYPENVAPVIEHAKEAPTQEDFRQMETEFLDEQHAKLDIDALQSQNDAAREALGTSIKHVMKHISSGGVKEAKESVSAGLTQAKQSGSALKEATDVADRIAAENLIAQANSGFLTQAQDAEKAIDANGREYWTKCSATFRNRMAEIVKNTSLSEEKKNELTDLIGAYRTLELDNGDNMDMFRVEEFDYLLDLGPVKLIRQNRINIGSLTKSYALKLGKTVDEIARSTQETYQNSFIEWEENLVNMVRANIVDYSPELNEQQKRIDEETAMIRDLRDRQNRLQFYVNEITGMIDWQE